MKDWPGGSYLVMKFNPRVPGGIPLLAIGYKYNYRKVLWFIATEGAGSTAPGDPYLSRVPDIYSNVSVHPYDLPHLIGRYFNACSAIDNQNRMRQSDLDLDKYWVTQSGYYRLETTVVLGMGITDGKLLYCHGVAEGNYDRRISTLEYNNRTVYDCFNSPFTYDFVRPYLNLPPITFDNRPHPHKRVCYTPDLLLADIFVASENTFSTLITPYDSPDLLPSDDTNNLHVMKIDVPVLGKVHRGYCCRKQDKNDATKRQVYIAPHVMIRTQIFIIVSLFLG